MDGGRLTRSRARREAQIHVPESSRGKSKEMPSLLEIGFEDTIGNQ
jgi:hypothetical protein